MPFSDINTLFPYMNNRDVSATYDPANAIGFTNGGTVTLKWGVEIAGTNKPTRFLIYGNGQWNTGFLNHSPFVYIREALPGPGTFNTYGTMADMYSAIPNCVVSQLNATTIGVEGTFGRVGSSYFVLCNTDLGVAWVPIRVPVPLGTTANLGALLIGGPFNCDLFKVDIPTDDFPIPVKPDGSLIMPLENETYFELCWAMNGRHGQYHEAHKWDAIFYLTPDGYPLQNSIAGRKDLMARVAGERAIAPDEFVPLAQLEAGHGISLLYRASDGSLAGYAPEAAKGYNVVIQSEGVLTTEGSDQFEVVYYAESRPVLRFQDRPEYHVEPEDGLLPVRFEVTGDPDMTEVRAYAYNNNLYVSHADIDSNGQLFPFEYPMNEAGFNQDTTVNHLRIIDTQTVEFSVTGTRMPTTTPQGDLYRKGVVVQAIRPLSIADNDGVVGDDSFRRLNLYSNTLHPSQPSDPAPTLEVGWSVIDRTGQPRGERDVRAFQDARHGVWQSTWVSDYDPGNVGRHLGWTDAYGIINGLFVPIHRYDGGVTMNDFRVDDVNFYQKLFAVNANFNANQYPTYDVKLRYRGTYLVDVSIEGIAGLAAEGTLPDTLMSQIVNPTVRLFLVGNKVTSTWTPNSNINNSLGSIWYRDYVPAGTALSDYQDVYTSRPWSIRGQCIYNYFNDVEEDPTLRFFLHYDGGTGENRFWFQVCTVSTRIIRLTGARDEWANDTGLALDRFNVSSRNFPNNWQTMNFQGI